MIITGLYPLNLRSFINQIVELLCLETVLNMHKFLELILQIQV